MKKRNHLWFLLICFGIIILSFMNVQARAGTVAYWCFEEGTPGEPVPKTTGGYVYEESVPDCSGNGNELSVWEEGSGAGYVYRSEVPYSIVPQTGAANNVSVKNTGGGPAMWTSINDSISTITPSVFTIEAAFKLENGGYRTIIGRDSQGSVLYDGNGQEDDLAALYFQAIPNNALAIKFCDVSGYWHEAISSTNAFTSFDYSSDPNGDTVPWYSMAAVSDGSTLSLYLLEHGTDTESQLIAQTDMTTSGSPDTALTAGVGSGGDWTAGEWSVGRGLFGGGHVDRAYGYVDEIRISDAALLPSEFLSYEESLAGIITSPSDLVVREEGTTSDDLYFSLESLPAGDVILTVHEKNDRGQVTLNPTVLTFTTQNWDVPQPISVMAVNDPDLENAEHEVPLSIVVSSAQDENYDSLDVEPVIVKVADNECGAWGYAAGDFNTDCVVDIDDLAGFVQDWLACSDPDEVNCTNYAQ